MALDILHDNWGPYTHTEVENALKAYLTVLENRINRAIQSGGVGLADLSTEVKALLNKANTALQPENIAAWAKAKNKPGYNVSEITYSNLLTLAEKLADMDQKIQAAASSGGVDPDDTMSDTSENAVQNKVIKAYVDDKVADAGKVKSVTINGTNHTPNSSGVVDLGTIQGQKGDKGDTGNCQITGDGGNIVSLIVNDLTTGGAGNILSAEMGKRLALMSGTYAQAWARSKAIPFPFCWIWDETVGSDAICKPIWHKGNSVFVDATGAVVSVDAPSSVPVAPTMTINGTPATSGGSYGENAELVITPAANSALYWRIGSGSWNVSDSAVAVTMPSGSLTIEAYCANQTGNSQTTSISVTVAGTATPSFAPASGTTIDNNGVVSRGGSVVVSVPQGGELHYRINGGSWTTASGLSVSIPIATNLNQGQMIVEAYNVKDGDESSHVTNSYTMAALDAPIFSQADGYAFPTFEGGKVTINIPAGATHVYYTTNGDTPTSSSTEYTSGDEITVAQSMTLKAIAVDTLGTSVVATASYTVPVDHKFQFKIRLTENNATEYVPVYNTAKHTMTVDWGDGSEPTVLENAAPANKSVSHQYSGNEGDIFTITLRGSSIPNLLFNNNTYCNKAALYSIDDNTLECITDIAVSGCEELASLCSNAFSNLKGKATKTKFVLKSTPKLSSLGDGLYDGFSLSDASLMFYNCPLLGNIPTSLKAAIKNVTTMDSMFSGAGVSTCEIPDDFFDDLTGGITSVRFLFRSSAISGDAKALYDDLVGAIAEGATTQMAFNGASNMSNKDQIPSDWK